MAIDNIAVVEGFYKHGTTHALLIKAKTIQGHWIEVWIPKSKISYKRINGSPTPDNRLVECCVHIPVWLAEAKGIDYEELAF